tara:strand:+ start:646 stop:849 length:204 start_codon:yes stop_codon:yes gene_type:complete
MNNFNLEACSAEHFTKGTNRGEKDIITAEGTSRGEKDIITAKDANHNNIRPTRTRRSSTGRETRPTY